MIHRIKSFFKNKNYNDPALNLNCSEFEINNFIISEFVAEKLFPITGAIPFPLSELMLMTASVCRFKPDIIFEWGTNIGKSARVFYEITKAFNINSEIHSIDLPDNISHNEHPKEKRGIMVKGLEKVHLHQGDGVTTAIEIYNNISGKKPGVLFFVDGDHSYESVIRELREIFKNVSNPIILLHDTFFQSEKSGYNIGPRKALNEIIFENKNTLKEISTNTGLPGMSLLYKAN